MIEYLAVGVGPLIVLGVIMYAYVRQNIDDIKKNWVKYRCHPAYMPFASVINPDVSASENFSYCGNLFTKSIFDYALVPVHQLFDMFNGILASFMGNINQFLAFIAGIDKFIFEIANTVFGKLQNTFSVLTGQLGHVRDVLQRITASAYYGVYIISTMVSFMFSAFGVIMTTLKALVGIIFAIAVMISLIFPVLLAFFIPIGAAVGIQFCFHPDTLINGKAIKDVQIGERLPGGKVTSILYFECPDSIDLYVYNNVIVSGRHLVFHENKWRYVRDTGAYLYEGVRPLYLVCLNTDTNQIEIGDTVFADYEETSDPKALSEIETIVWGKQIDQEYGPGLNPRSTVRLANGTKIALSEVKLGTQLQEGRVTGLVLSNGYYADWYNIGDGCLVSGFQPVNGSLGKDVGVRSDKTPNLSIQIFIDNKTGLFTINDRFLVRDYPDSHDEKTLEAIQGVVLRYLNDAVKK